LPIYWAAVITRTEMAACLPCSLWRRSPGMGHGVYDIPVAGEGTPLPLRRVWGWGGNFTPVT